MWKVTNTWFVQVRQLLKHTRQLHIRWVTERGYESLAPFSSRISPGLHVLLSGDGDHEQETWVF